MAEKLPSLDTLFNRYAEDLARLAERHLSRRVARRESGEDVVQSVFRTLLRRHAAGQIRFDDSDKIWHLLVTITIRKARAKGRRHTAECRNVGVEEAADIHFEDVVTRGAQPDEALVFIEEIERILHGLSDLHGAILGLRLLGNDPASMATELNVSRRTIERTLKLFRERLQVSKS